MHQMFEKAQRYPDGRPVVGSALLIISGLFLLLLGIGYQFDSGPLSLWIPPLLHSVVVLSGGAIVLVRPDLTRRVGIAILLLTALLLLVTRTIQVFWTPVIVIGALYCLAWSRARPTARDRSTVARTEMAGERARPFDRN